MNTCRVLIYKSDPALQRMQQVRNEAAAKAPPPPPRLNLHSPWQRRVFLMMPKRLSQHPAELPLCAIMFGGALFEIMKQISCRKDADSGSEIFFFEMNAPQSANAGNLSNALI